MNGYHSTSQILIIDTLEARLSYHLLKLVLLGKHAYTLDQILITVLVIGDYFAQFWDDIHRVKVVELSEARDGHMRELEAHEFAALSEHTVGFFKGFGSICDVSDAKRNGVEVLRIRLDSLQVFSV